MPRLATRAAAKRTRPAPAAVDHIELTGREQAFLDRIGQPSPDLTLDGAKFFYFARMAVAQRWRPETVKRQELDLGLFVRLDPACPIRDVSLRHVWRWLGAVKHLRLATQRSRFQAITQFLDWCVRKQLVAKNPCRLLELDERPWTSRGGKAQVNAGKTPLPNMDAVVRYCRAANTLRDRHERVAAQLLVYCGLRSGEVRNLRAGDVDLLLGRIWVRPCDEAREAGDTDWNVKTASSRRTVLLPVDLKSDLAALCKGKAVTQLLFPRPRRGTQGQLVRHANWLIKLVARVCKLADLATVCPHGLRVTYASIQQALGTPFKDLSMSLGHANTAVTQRHYAGVAAEAPSLRLVHPPDAA